MPVDLTKTDQKPELTATLYINLLDSRCGHCRRQTMPADTHHRDISGYTFRPGAGCGALFINTATDYPAHITPARLKAQRPDLPVRQDQQEPARPATTMRDSAERAARRMLHDPEH